MGECCSNESKHDQNFRMVAINSQQYRPSGMQGQKAASELMAGGNLPEPSSCEKVKEMNQPSPVALKKIKELGPLAQPQNGPDLSRVPEVGPYRYADGSTYRGQYHFGMRAGWGTCIYPDGSIYEGYF